MWPFTRRKSAFEVELSAVRALPEPTSDPRNAPNYGNFEPVVYPPLSQPNQQSGLAGPPVIDKFPVVIGANLTGAHVSSAFRLATSGWRYSYVDLLDELLENDPDTRCVVRARVIGIACGRYTVEPAKLGKNASDADRELAKVVASEFELEFENIPFRPQRIQQLAWADWYGVSALEIKWEHPSAQVWNIADLCHIHNRRLNYTSPTSWELYVYDQGLVGPGSDYIGPTTGVYGLPVAKFPGKFLVHTPALSGQYPTRDGEGRYVAFYMLLKRMVTRCTAQDFERVIRPWVLGYFNRAIQAGKESPVADKLDIALLNAAMQAFGSGSMNAAALPNTVKVELLRAAAAMTATEFLSYLNKSIAKALLGQAFTTEPGDSRVQRWHDGGDIAVRARRAMATAEPSRATKAFRASHCGQYQ
jgi:phage gp29-like protein